MAPQEIEDLIDRTAKKVAAEVGEQVVLKLTVLGLNTTQPDQQRADLDHLRRCRAHIETVGRSGMTALVTSATIAVMTAIYYGAQAALSFPKK